ncbi:MAG TPA: hypothetical protein VL172_07860 [Kofleriaceae bacterium]|nr:hypothetical protein [Kofleriaceae bacterium]
MHLAPPLLLAIALAGCAPRSAPYRFRGPVVSSVRVGELRSARTARGGDRIPEPVPVYDVIPPPQRQPGPQRQAPLAPAGLDDELRALVGLRQKTATQLDFVRSALAAIGSPYQGDLGTVTDGPALAALAQARGALATDAMPHRGDLLLFDDVVPGHPASLIGVVVAVDARGVIEFIHLTRGIVRRGYLSPSYPHLKRDGDGRVLNVILRQEHGEGEAGAGDLAGDLFSAYVRLERLRAP